MMSDKLGSVENKLSCLFEISVLSEPSSKRSHQPFRVLATDKLREEALQHDVHNSHPSEKLDGTCVLISYYQGKPWLWARHDRKPNKQSDKKFKTFQTLHGKWEEGKQGVEPTFLWNVSQDFREVPHQWKPALGVNVTDGLPQPDSNGHIPGWVPVDPKSRQHCWHLTAVDLDRYLGLILREGENKSLEIVAMPLAALEGHTAELIGTNINGNPYGIGSKQFPIHFLVVHGSISVSGLPVLDQGELTGWFFSTEMGRVEGIVWHCPDRTLFKLHRHHIGLPWPIKDPVFASREVKLCVDVEEYNITKPGIYKEAERNLFWVLGKFLCMTCASVRDIHTTILGKTKEDTETQKDVS